MVGGRGKSGRAVRAWFVVATAALTLLLSACGTAGGAQVPPPPGQGAGVPGQGAQPAAPAGGQPGAGAANALAGDWLGPEPGDTGRCGQAYGEWYLQPTGSYSFTTNSSLCGGFTNLGRYQVQGNVIYFQQTGVPNCPTCQQTANFSVTYKFVTANALEICDNYRCYTYYRQ